MDGSKSYTHKADPLAWVDALSDEGIADILGPGWFELTGCSADHLIPDHSESAVA